MKDKRSTLFDGFFFLLIASDEFPVKEAKLVAELLTEGGATQVTIKQNYDTSKNYITKSSTEDSITHIISLSMDFQEASLAEEFMIPIISPDWVTESVEQEKILTTKPYNPDPRFFFRDIFVSVADLPEGDKEAIYGGVNALGGQFLDQLTKFTTHLIALNTDNDKCLIAQSTDSQVNIKIVLPHWIDDCLKLRRRIDEGPYLLPNPKILSPDYINKTASISQANADLDISIGHNSQLFAQSKELPKFLNKKTFFLSDDLELSARGLSTFTTLIEDMGGQVVPQDIEISQDNIDVYIGKYRDGLQFKRATRYDLLIGNIDWIYWMIVHNKWILPTKKLLHYPVVRNGHPQFRDLKISATNYTGDARHYLAKLVEALGGTFTKTLRPNDTHLICAKPIGKKYDAAVKWGVKTLNHLWLEESYSKWSKQDENHPRYKHYANGVNLENVIGKTELDMNVLKAWYASDSEIHVHVSNSTAQSEVVDDSVNNIGSSTKAASKKKQSKSSLKRSSPEFTPLPDTPKKAKTSSTELSTPALRQLSYSGMDIPSSGSRKAKSKAAAKLHSDMEELNYFQKQTKSRDTPMLPSEVDAMKRSKDLAKISKSRDNSLIVQEDDRENESKESNKSTSVVSGKAEKGKRLKKSKSPEAVESEKPYNVHATTTGCDELDKSEIQLLSQVGITFELKDPSKATYIIAPRIMRTEKFLVGLSAGPLGLIHPKFLNDVISKMKADPNMSSSDLKKAVSIEKYAIDKIDKKIGQDLKVSCTQLTVKSRDRCVKKDLLFKGMAFNISSDSPGGPAVVSKILMSHGSLKNKTIKTVSNIKTLVNYDDGKDKMVVFITKKNVNQKQVNSIKKVLEENKSKGFAGKVIDWEWVVQSILKMDLESFEDYLV